jgi:RNA polymerase sigma-70 factor (ECF subfamily)
MFFNRLNKKTDEELMLLISNGEERALTELYHRYSKPMVRYFFRMLWKDENKAQDFLHDLFIKIIETPQIFNPEKKLSTWLFSIAHNMCKNEYRRQNFRNAAQLIIDEKVESTAGRQLDHDEFRRALDIVLSKWNEDDKSLFVMRHEMDMSIAEISEALSLPEGTVKSRWFYMRKSLAEQLHAFETILK